jgi:hypothetical protein
MYYSEITSAYIMNLIQNSPWQDHNRIDALISLHRYILDPPRNWSGGMAFTHLKSQYRTEYLELLCEHSPETLKKVLSDEKARSEYRIKKQAEYDAFEEQSKKSWLLAGGCL